MMKAIDRRQRAKDAVARWHAEYDWRPKETYWKQAQDKTAQLDALGPDPDPNDVDRIIGNESWTRMPCAGCLKDVPVALQIQAEDPDDDPVYLCENCVRMRLHRTVLRRLRPSNH